MKSLWKAYITSWLMLGTAILFFTIGFGLAMSVSYATVMQVLASRGLV